MKKNIKKPVKSDKPEKKAAAVKSADKIKKKYDLKSLEDFLKPTEFCDSDHPDIIAAANAITWDCITEKEKAMSIFYYVRDNFPYTFGNWNWKASETLKSKVGMCTNKANIMVALLRAAGIPAGYGLLKVNAQDYFGPVTPVSFRFMGSKRSVHIYPYVWLDGRWIKADASTDRALAEKTAYLVYSTIIVEWDGFHDAIDPILPTHVYSDEGPFATIDFQMKKKPRKIIQFGFKYFNYFLSYMRTTKEKFANDEDLERGFLKWSLRTKPVRGLFISIVRIYGLLHNYFDKK